jgi:hypothetical protein
VGLESAVPVQDRKNVSPVPQIFIIRDFLANDVDLIIDREKESILSIFDGRITNHYAEVDIYILFSFEKFIMTKLIIKNAQKN